MEARTPIDEEDQQGESHAKANIDEALIRRTVAKAFRDAMDAQLNDRQSRFNSAIFHKNTEQLWQLITAAVEEANIVFHHLEG